MSTLARALSHPTRRRILQILSERIASPREIAAELGAPIGRVSHHVRWLAARDYIELTGTQPRRGALEHFYRARLRPELKDEEWSRIPARRRRELTATLLRDIWSDVLDADEAGALAADDVHLSRTLLALDDEGRRALAQALQDLVQLALRLERESAERSGNGPTERSGNGPTERSGDPPTERSELAILRFDRVDT
jgi:DNA-binding transcriptional ArsR family regulator